MSSDACNRHTPPYNEHHNDSQTPNNSHHLYEVNMEDWNCFLPLQPTEFSSTHTEPSQPSMNTDAYNDYAAQVNPAIFNVCPVEHGAQSYNNQSYIHDAFVASQGYVDEKIPRDHYGMTIGNYQQLNNGYNTSGNSVLTPLNYGSTGQYGYGSITGNYTNQVTQVPEQFAERRSLNYYPPVQSSYGQPSQDPYWLPQVAHAGHRAFENPQSSFQSPLMSSHRAPQTSGSYPSPPRTTGRAGMGTAQLNTADIPTKKPGRSVPKASKNQSDTRKAYEQRKKLQCDEPGCNVMATCASNLAQHKLTHNGEKNYACEVEGCLKRFHRPWGLGRHYKDVHRVKDVKVKKLDGVRNFGGSGSPSQKPRRRNNAGTGSPVSQQRLPEFVAPTVQVDIPSPANHADESSHASSPTVSIGKISSDGKSTGDFDLASSNSPSLITHTTTSPAAISFNCSDCGFQCPTAMDLACHGHNLHGDAISNQCNCFICIGHGQQQLQQQEQQQDSFEVVDMYALQQAQAQAQTQTQTQTGHQGDIDMNTEPQDSKMNPALPTTPAQDTRTTCSHSPPDLYHIPLTTHDSPMTSTPNTDIDTKMENEDYVYPPPTPHNPWDPLNVPSHHPKLEISFDTIDTNLNPTTLDPFALDTEMANYLTEY